MNPSTDVVALVSMRQDVVSGRLTRDPADALAAALALKLDAGSELLATGEMSAAVARAYLAIGARSITVLQPETMPSDDPGSRAMEASFPQTGPAERFAPASESMRCPRAQETGAQWADVPGLPPTDWMHAARLVTYLKASSSLILAGSRTEEHLGASGLLPYLVAHALSVPLIADVVQVERDSTTDGAWLVQQALPRGARRRFRVSGRAVLIVSPGIGLRVPHAHESARRGQIRHVHLDDQHPDTGADDAILPPRWQMQPARRSLRPLMAAPTGTGPQRLAQTLGRVQASGAGTRLQHGDAREQAAVLLEHLRSRNLIRF